MEIIKNNTGELEATLIVKIEEKDYAEQYESELHKIRKSAQIKGFRPGKVPFGMVKKMYGVEVKAQEVHKYLDEQVKKYFDENKLNIIGDLLPSETEETKFDIENSNDFQFAFDLGFFPDVEIKTEEISVPEYNIKVEDKTVEEEIKNLTEKYGDFVEIDEVVEKSQIRAAMVELNDDNTPKEDGISIEDGLVLISYLAEDTRKKVMGAKKDAKFTVDVKKSFPNETDLAALLKIEKEKLADINNNFELTIQKIEQYQNGQLNQEFFDKLFGKDEVKSEEEMKAKMNEIIGEQYKNESRARFNVDLKKILKETIELPLPDEFLVKWQKNRRKEVAEDVIRKELDDIKEAIRWDRILAMLSEMFDIQVEQVDLMEAAKAQIVNQIVQMGLSTQMFNDEQLNQFASQELERMSENDRYYLVFSVMENKVLHNLYEKVNKEPKDITFDELKNMYEEENKKIAEQQKEKEEEVKKEEEVIDETIENKEK
ncbi:MAG: hypothetical protein JXL97_04325 [Bacteroidales bacterium]|nr:hypothetical protein [Bacteroidales bacterium]